MTKKITRWLATLLPAVATAGLLFTGNAAAATTSSRITFGMCQADGNFATCVASGHIHRPSAIYVSVYTRPSHLSVTIYWDMVCSKGSGAGESSGHFTTATPRTDRYIAHPYARPGSCDVSAEGQVNGNAQRIRVWLSAYKWG
jgi:hypothetical protein